MRRLVLRATERAAHRVATRVDAHWNIRRFVLSCIDIHVLAASLVGVSFMQMVPTLACVWQATELVLVTNLITYLKL